MDFMANSGPGETGREGVLDYAQRISCGWPVDARTLLHNGPSGSIFFLSDTARLIGTWVNWWFQKLTSMFVRPLIPACTALWPSNRQKAES